MSTCQDCQYYEPDGPDNGTCFGLEVSANQDAEDCPAKAFKPRDKE